MIRTICTALLLLLASGLLAQTDTVYTRSYLDKSTRFAWLTYGGDLLYQSGGSTQFMQGNGLQDLDFGSSLIPRLTIGGIHFWGHADFYVTFPLASLAYQSVPDRLSDLELYQGVETGIRLYPLKLQPGRISPFAGISLRRMRFEQEGEATQTDNGVPNYGRFTHPIQVGLTYTTPKWHISASAYINHQRDFDYYISPDQQAAVQLDPVTFNLSLLRYVDSDRFMREPDAVARINRNHETLRKARLLSAWFVAVGPSAALQVTRSPYLRSRFPFFYDNYSAALLPDISIGRYLHEPDLNVNLSYRTYGDRFEGFDQEISIRRHSVGIESVKFLFNYLGFVPFVGPALTYENLRATVNGVDYQESKAALGIVFGWDIRVTNTGTSLLRTNLRYFPGLHLDIEGERMPFDHLEFNFIQWVQFIGRGKAYQGAR